MHFVEATDRLLQAGVTLEEVARALGVSYGSVKAARLDPSTASHRSPPAGWESAVAKLARERGQELFDLAGELEELEAAPS